jgi:hypothetical protein
MCTDLARQTLATTKNRVGPNLQERHIWRWELGTPHLAMLPADQHQEQVKYRNPTIYYKIIEISLAFVGRMSYI